MNPAKKISLLLAWMLLAAKTIAGMPEIHVAPGGDDRGIGAPEKPLATLEAAQAKVRKMKKIPGGLITGAHIVLHGGTYILAKPLTFTAEDSGEPQAPIVYTAAPGETVLLSGGAPIEKWAAGTLGGKACWVVDLAAQGRKDWNFKELFVNGARRPRTRLPQTGFFRFDKATPKHEWTTKPETARFVKGDLKNWSNLGDVDLVFLNRWFDCHEKIASIDETSATVRFAPRASQGVYDSLEQPARYFVENVKEALSEPGQWYLDHPSGKLYYLPLPGETMEKTQAFAPALETVVQIGAKNGSQVHDLRLEHLSFAHATPVVRGPATPQAAVSVHGVVRMDNAAACTLYDCAIEHVGGYAVEVGPGCADCQVVACRMEDLGAGGVRIEAGSRHTTVSDCTIKKAARIWLQACGILALNSAENRIVHNEICDLEYTAVSCGWTWGYAPTATADNRIEYNHLHNLGTGALEDMGGIYTLGAQPGAVIRGNVIHDVVSYNYGAWGIYPDEGSAYMLIEGNLVYRCARGGFHQHYGRDNMVRNNIFALGEYQGLQRTRREAVRSFTFDRNIIMLTPTAKLFFGNWNDGHYVLRNDLYWRAGGGEILFLDKPLAEWQKLGRDAGSAIANPLFADPDHGDFKMAAESPALKMGFKPIDAAKAGPRKIDARKTAFERWPKADDTKRAIVMGVLETEETLARRGGGRFDQPIALTAQTPANVIYKLSNPGPLPAKGEVTFRLTPADAATIEGPAKIAYDLKPGEKTELKFKLIGKTSVNAAAKAGAKTAAKTASKRGGKRGGKAGAPAVPLGAPCLLEALPRGTGLSPSALYFN